MFYLFRLGVTKKLFGLENTNLLKSLHFIKQSKYNKLSDYIISVMTNLDKAKIETDIGNYALRKSTKVEILDEKLIPEEYFNISIDKTVNKVTLKEVLKSQEVPGVRLSTGYNLNIQ